MYILYKNNSFCISDEASDGAVCELLAPVCIENKRHGWVVSVYTKPEHRGRGYQQALMQEQQRAIGVRIKVVPWKVCWFPSARMLSWQFL